MNQLLDTLLEQLDLFKIAAVIAAAVWSWARVKAEKELDLDNKILRALEHGVQEAWEHYVRDIKLEGRKLTKTEREKAQVIAMNRAKEAGKSLGVDLEAELGGSRGLKTEIQNVVDIKKGA